jgi:hypothetical protein
MTRWRWPGLLAVDVPSGWEVRELGDLLEFLPPAGTGAAQISVLRRTNDDLLREGEAVSLAGGFAEKLGAHALDVHETGTSDTTQTASATFRTSDDDGELLWDLEVHLWIEKALLCTYCRGATDDPSRASALEMFASITAV